MALLYTSSDMARIGCNNCEGCHSCCENMGDTVKLDPYDVHRLSEGLDRGFDKLMGAEVELHVENRVMIPHLKMSAENSQCVFLNGEGRCSIHSLRPGICRLFPLGRNYKDGRFDYFIVEGACVKNGHSKVKIEKWLQQEDLAQYERFVADWHYMVKKLGKVMSDMENDDQIKNISLYILQEFYVRPYTKGEFYKEFYERYDKVNKVL